MIERILKIVYVFTMFINVGLYGVSFILKLNVIPSGLEWIKCS